MNKIINLLKIKKLFIINCILILVLFAIDIYTKRLAFSYVRDIKLKTSGIHTHIQVNSFLNIVQVINTGVSFGMFNSLEYGRYILSIITVIIVSIVSYLLWKENTKYTSITYSFIIAGGLGNLYDRLTYGGVFDFLDFHIGEYHWPAFNIADSLICIAVAIIVLEPLYKKIIDTIKKK